MTAYTGFWGSGKTLALVEECERRRLDGYDVYSNFGFKRGRSVDTLGDVISLCALPTDRPRFLALDEAGALFPSRGWSDFPPALNILWQQGRKLGFSVSYTAQDIDLVDANVRRVTGLTVKCDGWFPKRLTPRKTRPRKYRPRLFSRRYFSGVPTATEKPAYTLWRFFKQEIADLYDTHYLVSSAQRMLVEQVEKMALTDPRMRALVEAAAELPDFRSMDTSTLSTAK